VRYFRDGMGLIGEAFSGREGTFAESIMRGQARECWPKLHTVIRIIRSNYHTDPASTYQAN
jgi:hypothetical protein